VKAENEGNFQEGIIANETKDGLVRHPTLHNIDKLSTF